VVHLEDPEGGPGQLILFITLSGGGALDDALRGRVRAALRSQLSPRHVPDVIEAVAAIPRTLTGKKLETPIKQILLGRAADEVISRDSVSDFAAITVFESFAADLRRVGAR
jgi:acetoacetyl-CoA synthetase